LYNIKYYLIINLMAEEKTGESREQGLQAQMPGESAKNYEAYLIYRNLGLDRTVTDAYDIFRKEYPAGAAMARARARAGSGQEKVNSSGLEESNQSETMLKNSAHVSGSFRRFAKTFKWVERAADYDQKLANITLDRNVCLERDDFLDRIAEAQKILETMAFKSMAVSQIGLDLLAGNMDILKAESDAEGSTKPSKVAEVSRAQLVVMQTVEIARRELEAAMGIADLHGSIEQINKRAAK
jgi:hypothetical protein